MTQHADRKTGAFKLREVAAGWWQHDGRHYRLQYLALPAVVGVATFIADARIESFTAVLAASTFLAGTMINLMFRVYDWAETAAAALRDDQTLGTFWDSWEKTRYRRRLEAIATLYHTLTWATLVALGLVVLTAVFSAGGSTVEGPLPAALPATLTSIAGSHLVVVLVAAVSRLFTLTKKPVQEAENAKELR